MSVISPPPETDNFIHATSVVDRGAQVGRGTRIWHFSHIMPGAVIGNHSSLGQNCFVASGVVIGDHVKIQNNVSLYDGVHLEDHVFCGPSMVFTNVLNPRSEVERKTEYRPTHVGRGATIGANATIVCGHSIGDYAFVGAGAVVANDVPAYALVLGVPGRIAGWMSRAGHRLTFDSSGYATCPETQERFRLIDDSRVEPVELAVAEEHIS